MTEIRVENQWLCPRCQRPVLAPSGTLGRSWCSACEAYEPPATIVITRGDDQKKAS